MTGCVYKINDGRCSNSKRYLMSCIGEPCQYQIPSHYDILVSKTPEELACWISQILMYCTSRVTTKTKECSKNCPLYKGCNEQPTEKNIKEWLLSSANN